jgi:methyl-accepting chemotaxis protein
VAFIASAHTVIEANFAATELVGTLRQEVKKLPSRGVTSAGQAASGPDSLQTAWQALTVPITIVRHSPAAQRSTPGVLEAVTQAFDKATQEYEQTKVVMASGKTDLDTLLERAIVIEKALGTLGEALGALTRELRQQLQVAVERERQIHDRPMHAGIAIGGLAIVLLAVFAWRFAAHFVKPLRHMTAVVTTMAEGDIDLERRMQVASQDEIGTLAAGFNVMLQHLAGLVRRVQQTGIEVTSSATQLAASGKQLESMMTEQVASTHEVVSMTQEIAATSQELAQTMQDVTTLSDHTATAAASSQAGLSQMATTMRQMEAATHAIVEKLSAIQQRADDITSVITTITKVADQTNLLSLNAAIEAEKAGEYGRGFAVVAREIRRLADQTAVATLAIERIIHEMRAAVTAGVMGMDQFAHEVQQGVEHVRTVGGQLGQIIAQVQALTPRFDTVNQGMQAQAGGRSRSAKRWPSSAKRRSRPPRRSIPRTRLSPSLTLRRKGCTTRLPASTTGRFEPGRWRTLQGEEDGLWNAPIAGTISACPAMVRARNWSRWYIATTVRSMLPADIACWSVHHQRSISANGPRRWPRRKTRIPRRRRSRCSSFGSGENGWPCRRMSVRKWLRYVRYTRCRIVVDLYCWGW